MKTRALLWALFILFCAGVAALGFITGYKEASQKAADHIARADDPVMITAAAPTPSFTAEPSSTAVPALTAAPRPAEADGFLVLVNLTNPMRTEPAVVNVSELLTAKNVVCDPRRHANETAILALNEMLLAAEEEAPELSFIIASAFRSVEEQSDLWELKLAEDPGYGTRGEPVKLMPPGCSEHVTGLAFDLLCQSCPHSDESFGNTPEGIWLRENARRFGFILRYPKDKQDITGVEYEPWHFRYVGKEYAEYMFANSLCLEEYLEP